MYSVIKLLVITISTLNVLFTIPFNWQNYCYQTSWKINNYFGSNELIYKTIQKMKQRDYVITIAIAMLVEI